MQQPNRHQRSGQVHLAQAEMDAWDDQAQRRYTE